MKKNILKAVFMGLLVCGCSGKDSSNSDNDDGCSSKSSCGSCHSSVVTESASQEVALSEAPAQQ